MRPLERDLGRTAARQVGSGSAANGEMALDRKRLLKPVKKLRKLVKRLDSEPIPEQVHDLRTNARRFEAEFEALSLDAQGVRTSILKKLRRCRKRAGKVRDLDVLTAYAATIRLKGEEECAVRLLEHLGAQRRKYARKLYAEVKRHRSALRKDLQSMPPLLDKLGRQAAADSGPSAAGLSAAGNAMTLALQLATPRRLDRGNLHSYRLKVKELRNLLQMAPGHGSGFADDLGKVKDAIGEWHDWEELVSMGRKALDHGGRCALIAELKRIAGRKYADALGRARDLRRDYLRSAPQKDRASAVPRAIPRESVWEAIAMLAG